MSTFTVRPTTAADVIAGQELFPGMQPNHWAPGGNRRSFALLGEGSEVLGHCRGIDNPIHPHSRTLVFEVAPVVRGTAAEVALLQAQIDASTLPLHAKPTGDDRALCALLERCGGILVQLMPPWRRAVGPELRRWAEQVLQGAAGVAEESSVSGASGLLGVAAPRIVPARDVPLAELQALEVEHYIAQHASWSPAADPVTLREAFAEDHDPRSADTWDRDCSQALVGANGSVLAAALLWGSPGTAVAPATGDDAPELVHLSRPFGGAEACAWKQQVIAAVVAELPDGAEVCIDAHASLAKEYAAIATIPGCVDRMWTAIVAVPVPGGPAPIPFSAELIPDQAAWARAFA